MKNRLSDNLIDFSNLLMLAHDRSQVIHLASKLNDLICEAMEIENAEPVTALQEKKTTLSAEIKFSKEEIDTMSKSFKKEFIANGCVAHIIKRPSGRKGYYYEIRYRRNGYNLTVSNADLANAKKLFIEATKHLDEPKKDKTKFGNIVDEWLEYKKDKITYHQWQSHESRARRFIPEELKSKSIKQIHTSDIDKLLDFKRDPRKYEEMRSLFNQVFKYAIASGIITNNPVTLIPFKRAKRKKRKALTKEQVKAFFKRLQQPEFERIRQIAYTLYFFGLRPCEIDKELHVEDEFLICRNRKRKGGEIDYKKIPIPTQARNYIDFTKPIKYPIAQHKAAEIIKQALGEKLTPYNLRHTFASTCAEYVKQDIVEVWMGDSPEKLVGKVYIHYSDEFMNKQMQKVEFTKE